MKVDLPSCVTNASMEDRITAVSGPITMPEKLELTTTSKGLDHPIFVLNTDDKVMETYKQNDATDQQSLFS